MRSLLGLLIFVCIVYFVFVYNDGAIGHDLATRGGQFLTDKLMESIEQ